MGGRTGHRPVKREEEMLCTAESGLGAPGTTRTYGPQVRRLTNPTTPTRPDCETAGRPIWHTIGTATIGTAGRSDAHVTGRSTAPMAMSRSALLALVEQLADQLAPELTGTVSEAVDAWEREHWPRLKPSTQEAYREVARRFVSTPVGDGDQTVGDLPAADLTPRIVTDAVTAQANGYRNCFESAVGSFLGWAGRNGWSGLERCMPSRRNGARARTYAFSDRDWEHFGTALSMARKARPQPWARQQTLDALTVGALTGMRLGELATLRWDEVSVTDRVAWLRHTKTGDRVIALSSVAAAIIDSQPRWGDYVWMRGAGLRLQAQAISNAYRKVRDRYGAPLVQPDNCFHSLRHSWASLGRRRGVPMAIIMAQLGWTSEQTARRYSHIGPSDLRSYVELVEGMLCREPTQLGLGVVR